MKPPAHRRAPAFTIAEVLIAMALVALLMAAAAMAIQAASSAHAYNLEKTDLLARSRGVLDRIARHVRLAASFTVPDAHTLVVTLPDETVHTYAWDSTVGGTLTYTKTDGMVSESGVLTDRVESFTASDDSPACTVRISLKGDLASSGASLTATPRKSVY
jgi:type II secretory pathway component PulJ